MDSRSTFVTVLAWIFIIGAGFTSIISIMQVIMLSTVFSGEGFSSMPEDAPAFAQFIQKYFHLFVYGFCALTLLTLVSSIALLKRKNWARLAFIVILSVGILWQLGGLVMQLTMFSDFPSPPPGEGFKNFERMHNIFRWFGVAIAIGVSGLFIWIIKKLVTQPIISEFTLHNNPRQDAS